MDFGIFLPWYQPTWVVIHSFTQRPSYYISKIKLTISNKNQTWTIVKQKIKGEIFFNNFYKLPFLHIGLGRRQFVVVMKGEEDEEKVNECMVEFFIYGQWMDTPYNAPNKFFFYI
jgi:hypothetical protein